MPGPSGVVELLPPATKASLCVCSDILFAVAGVPDKGLEDGEHDPRIIRQADNVLVNMYRSAKVTSVPSDGAREPCATHMHQTSVSINITTKHVGLLQGLLKLYNNMQLLRANFLWILQVLEFDSLGTRVRNTKRFFILNTTNIAYEFVWAPMLPPAVSALGGPPPPSPFNCAVRKGTISEGR